MFDGEPGKSDSLIPVLLLTLGPLPWSDRIDDSRIVHDGIGNGGELERYWDTQCDEIVAMSVNVWTLRLNAMIEWLQLAWKCLFFLSLCIMITQY